MAYDGKLLARARTALEARRADNQKEHETRVNTVYARVPEIRQLDAQMRRQMTELVRVTIAGGAAMPEKLELLRRANLDTQARRAELLVEHGWPIDYLDEIVSCPKCRDTGVYGGKPCECLVRLYNRELTRELSALLQGDESFERFDLSLYSDAPDENGTVPREVMRRVKAACEKYAENFPNVSSNLLFQGGTGLGKTYLSACIARVVSGKGFSVCYDSAAAALETFERQRFSRDTDAAEAAGARVERMLDCDLMLLDDLGTEMVTSLSTSALYTLLNTRLVNGRRTVISTNCSDEELRRRYPQPICSRLEGEFLHLPFVGKDIRLLKKK